MWLEILTIFNPQLQLQLAKPRKNKVVMNSVRGEE